MIKFKKNSHPFNQIQNCVELVSRAKKPVLVFGSQALLPPTTANELKEAVEKMGIPCFLGEIYSYDIINQQLNWDHADILMIRKTIEFRGVLGFTYLRRLTRLNEYCFWMASDSTICNSFRFRWYVQRFTWTWFYNPYSSKQKRSVESNFDKHHFTAEIRNNRFQNLL